MTLDSTQLGIFEQPVAKFAYLVEFNFLGGRPPAAEYVRLCTLGQTINWNSIDWLGVGGILNISGVEESESLVANSLTFTLNVAQASYLAIAVGAVESYRGRPAKMWVCPVDENFKRRGTPQVCWTGFMDTISVNVDGEQGNIQLKCENSAYSLKRRNILRINSAQQKQRHPAVYGGLPDTGFDYLNNLISQPQTWLSKKFSSV